MLKWRNAWQTSLRKPTLSLFHQIWDIIIRHLIILYIIICFYSAIISLFTGNKHLPSHITSIPEYIYPTIIKSIYKKKNKKCDLTWSIMTKCFMKKNWTCSAAALELRLASCFIRQFLRLIVHFYSELTSNHPRVFVITSFSSHVEFGR